MLTKRQRENLGKIAINAINLDLGTMVARYFMGDEAHRLTLLLACVIIAFGLTVITLLLDR